MLLEEMRVLYDVRREDLRWVIPKRTAFRQHTMHELRAHHLALVPPADSRVKRRRQEEARDIKKDAATRLQIAHRPELPHDRHQRVSIQLRANHSYTEMRLSVVLRVRLEQKLERHLTNSFSATGILRIHVTGVKFFGALD